MTCPTADRLHFALWCLSPRYQPPARDLPPEQMAAAAIWANRELAAVRSDLAYRKALKDLRAHIHTCPACRAVAARFTPPSEELVERLETGRIWDTTERTER